MFKFYVEYTNKHGETLTEEVYADNEDLAKMEIEDEVGNVVNIVERADAKWSY